MSSWWTFSLMMRPLTSSLWTVDSGAGCNVWPQGRRAGHNSLLLPWKREVEMVVANGTSIEYHEQRRVRFRKVKFDLSRVFPGRGGPNVPCWPRRETEQSQ